MSQPGSEGDLKRKASGGVDKAAAWYRGDRAHKGHCGEK